MLDQVITNELHAFGPIAVFLLLMLSGVGLPLGEDVITIPAGAFIAAGHMGFWPTVIAAYLGVVCSDCLWFAACSRYGTPLLHKRWLKRLVHPRRMLQAKHQFEKRGTWLIIMARFIPSSRTTTITVAGLLHMPFWKFAVATVACTLVTAPMQLGLGYLIGRGIGTENTAELLLRIIGLIMLIVAVTVVLGWWLQHRAARGRAPRAKAAWLRRFRPRRRRRSSPAPPGAEIPAAGTGTPVDPEREGRAGGTIPTSTR